MSSKLFNSIFEYHSVFAQKNILIAFRTSIYLNRHHNEIESLVKEISDLDLPRFLMMLDKKITKLENLTYLNEMKRSPAALQDSPLTWLYYSVFFALKLNKNKTNDYQENKFINAILFMILEYHQLYFRYKKKQQKENDLVENSIYFFRDATLTVVRMCEYLFSFVAAENDYLTKVYFSNLAELDLNFLNIFSIQDKPEQNCFFIKHDLRVGNFLVYQNEAEDIHIQIESTRMLRKGGQSNNSFVNNNISKYFSIGKEYYFKIKNFEFTKKAKRGGTGGSREKIEIQDTEEEEFNKNLTKNPIDFPTEYHTEDIHEAESLQKLKRRAFPARDEKQETPNLYKQHLRNKAFSANVTKRALLLPTSYDIPPLPILKEFLMYITKTPINDDMQIIDVYKSIFLLDCLLGVGYIKIIQILIEDSREIKFDNSYLTHKLNPILFAKSSANDYLQKSENNLIYRIPYGAVLLINKTKSYFREFDKKEKKSFYNNDEAQKYFTYIKQKVKEYPKQISFNPNQIWKIVDSFKKTYLFEDMSTMFCTGRFQQNDTPSLAYSSTNKRAQNHSKLLDLLFEKLELHLSIGNLLKLNSSILKNSIEFTNSLTYSGSSRVLKPEKGIDFFRQLKRLIQNESDKEKYFNLVSIYTRYALSLLLGTRGFENSASLERVSFSTHTVVLTEKSQTLLSGIRVIPLCDMAQIIIQNYQTNCRDYVLSTENIYLTNQEKYYIYTQKYAVEILTKYEISEDIINFVKQVPLNTGRHVITKLAMETNFNIYYLKTFLGHYIAGGEQFGIYSTLDIKDYILRTRELTSKIAQIYGV